MRREGIVDLPVGHPAGRAVEACVAHNRSGPAELRCGLLSPRPCAHCLRCSSTTVAMSSPASVAMPTAIVSGSLSTG